MKMQILHLWKFLRFNRYMVECEYKFIKINVVDMVRF